jgi:DNA-binding MurR/RpiR family transcriptional regulator
VVRFARRLGYSGYQSMKIGIAGRMGSVSTISEEITREDSCFEIYTKCSPPGGHFVYSKEATWHTDTE